MAYRKRAPTVLQVPNGSGVGAQPPIQVPISDESIISLLNLSSTANLTLCNDETFSTTWPLPANGVLPQPGIDNLWIQNSSGTDAEVLVLTYDARFPNLTQPTIASSGYASLTGPGETTSPGDLTQEGDLVVVGTLGVSGDLDVTGDLNVNGGINNIASSISLVLDGMNGLFTFSSLLSLESPVNVTIESVGASIKVLGGPDTITINAPNGLMLQTSPLSTLGFYGHFEVTQRTVSGMLSAVTDPNAAAVLASLISDLADTGLIVDGTT